MNMALAAIVSVAVIGFAMMMGGIIASMMAAEAGSVEMETSLAAVKAAWRSGDWRRDPFWRRFFVMACGVALFTVGLFGSFIVVGPVPVKVLCAGAILYPAIRLTRALRQS